MSMTLSLKEPQFTRNTICNRTSQSDHETHDFEFSTLRLNCTPHILISVIWFDSFIILTSELLMKYFKITNEFANELIQHFFIFILKEIKVSDSFFTTEVYTTDVSSNSSGLDVRHNEINT